MTARAENFHNLIKGCIGIDRDDIGAWHHGIGDALIAPKHPRPAPALWRPVSKPMRAVQPLLRLVFALLGRADLPWHSDAIPQRQIRIRSPSAVVPAPPD